MAACFNEATDNFKGDAKRKNIEYEVTHYPGLPGNVIGDQRRVRQAVSNVIANAIQNTSEGGVKVELYLCSREEEKCEIEVSVQDTGVGMTTKKLDQLFRELEQVQTEEGVSMDSTDLPDAQALTESTKKESERALGLGLAVVARIIRNMNGQLRLKSEEGKGSRFVIQFPFDLPDSEPQQPCLDAPASSDTSAGSVTPQAEPQQPMEPMTPPQAANGEVTLIQRGSASARRRSSNGDSTVRAGMSRNNSQDSVHSKRSIGSAKSGRSGHSFSSNLSAKSEADRLIEAIQQPHGVEGWRENSSVHRASRSRGGSAGSASTFAGSSRPKLDKRHTTAVADSAGSPIRSRTKSVESSPNPGTLEHLRVARTEKPGESLVMDQATPIRPVRVPDDIDVSSSPADDAASESMSSAASVASATSTRSKGRRALPESSPHPMSPDHMRVLVAEDDPVNSKIIKKRLEKPGHEVFLTVNGEECSSSYCDRSSFFDIVLMDMQASILDL